jgi:hypothetical protein
VTILEAGPVPLYAPREKTKKPATAVKKSEKHPSSATN